MDDLAIQLEAYVMSGLKGTCRFVITHCDLTPVFPPGVVVNAKMKMLELKRKTTTLILKKLCRYVFYTKALLLSVLSIGTLTGAAVTRMAYDRFDELITDKYHVVIRNWPLKKFCNPSAVTSRIELELLYNAWQSGATHFQKLTHEEMGAWESGRFSSRMELMGPPADPIPALTSPQAPAAGMTLLSELPLQDHPELAPIILPNPIRNVPLAPITNLTSGCPPVTTLHPPVPDPDMITAMIRADPTLQNVDPTLIAMGVAESSQRPATTAASTVTPIRQPPNRISPADSSKRRWQEVITPLSFDARAAKKTKRRQKGTQPQIPPAA